MSKFEEIAYVSINVKGTNIICNTGTECESQGFLKYIARGSLRCSE